MSPIEWRLTRVHGDPESAARRLAARTGADGMVAVERNTNPRVLMFSAVAKTGGLSPLALAAVAAFSISEGVRKDTGIISWVRWPDRVAILDSVVGRSAVSLLPGRDGRAILNFSVNLLNVGETGATSLEEQLGVQVDEKMLLDKILESLSWMHFGWTNGMEEHVLKRVRLMTETLERRVSVRKGSSSAAGKATDIDAVGRLVVRLDTGETVFLAAADELLAES